MVYTQSKPLVSNSFFMNMNKSKSISFTKHNFWKLSLELIVVFLGVTAGFLFNNMGQNLQDKKTEQRYLIGFQNEVKLNIEELQKEFVDDSLWLNRAAVLYSLFEKGNTPIDSVLEAVSLISKVRKATLISTTFENITNSGNLNLIQNFQLKQSIVDNYTLINDIRFFDDYLFSFYSDYTLAFLISDFSLLPSETFDNKTINTTKALNIFTLTSSFKNTRHNYLKNLLENSKELLLKLDS